MSSIICINYRIFLISVSNRLIANANSRLCFIYYIVAESFPICYYSAVIETTTNTEDLIRLSAADKLLAKPAKPGKVKGKRSYFAAWLVRNNRLPSVKIGGTVFVRLSDVLAYKPARRGRPRKLQGKGE